jgi:hypothetical protein
MPHPSCLIPHPSHPPLRIRSSQAKLAETIKQQEELALMRTQLEADLSAVNGDLAQRAQDDFTQKKRLFMLLEWEPKPPHYKVWFAHELGGCDVLFPACPLCLLFFLWAAWAVEHYLIRVRMSELLCEHRSVSLIFMNAYVMCVCVCVQMLFDSTTWASIDPRSQVGNRTARVKKYW